MQYFKSVFITLSILFLSTQLSMAGGTTYKCAGEDVSIIWSSNNCSNWAGEDSPGCIFTKNSGGQTASFLTPPNGCSVSYSCNAGAAADTATLAVENTPRCCSVGTAALEGRSVWNGSTCVRPSVGDFLVSTAPGSATIASGWAFDPDTPAQSVNGHFYMDGPATAANNFANNVGAGLCSNPRPDMVQWFPGATPAFNNFGCGSHDVSRFCDNNPHTVYMYVSDAAGTTWNLATTHAFSCAPTTPTTSVAPTANLTADRTTAMVGDTINYTWSSTGGVSYASSFSSSPSVRCGGAGSWMANSASGARADDVTPVQAGCTYTLSYTVTAADGRTAVSSVTISVGTAVPTTCSNGAINPPTCNQCGAGKTLVLGRCTANCTNGAINPPPCDVFPAPCTNGAINGPACDVCPAGYDIYNIAIGCTLISPTTITAAVQPASNNASNTANVKLNYVCNASATNFKIFRNVLYNPIYSGTIPPVSGSYVDSVPLSDTDKNTPYYLVCYQGSVYLSSAQTSVIIKSKIYINVTQNPIITTGSNAVIKWTSNGNNCDLRDKPSSNLVISNVSKTGTGPYNYTATLTSSSPLFRTELNTSGAYGYGIICGDSTDNTRPLQTAPALVTVYKPTKATAADNNNGSATLTCTADWTSMVLKNDDTGINISGFSFTNNVKGLDKTVTYNNLASTPNITLICSNQYQSDSDSLPKNALTLSASVISAVGSSVSFKTVGNPVYPATIKEETLNVVSNTPYFSLVNYEVSGATSYSVEFAGSLTGTLAPAGPILRLSSGDETKNISNFGPYLAGSKIKITASRGGITKILNINLDSSIVPVTKINGVTWIDDSATINFTCEDATSYSIKNSDNTILDSGSIAISPYNGSFTYTMQNGETTKNLIVSCSGAGKNVNLVNPAFAPATFQSLMIYPAEQVCGGGNVTVTWKIKDAKGKACKITAENISKNEKSGDALPLVRASLAAAKYESLVTKTGSYNSSTVFDDQNREGVSIGTVSGINVRYSTRFNVTCGGSPTVIPQTSKSVDVKVICRGQE